MGTVAAYRRDALGLHHYLKGADRFFETTEGNVPVLASTTLIVRMYVCWALIELEPQSRRAYLKQIEEDALLLGQSTAPCQAPASLLWLAGCALEQGRRSAAVTYLEAAQEQAGPEANGILMDVARYWLARTRGAPGDEAMARNAWKKIADQGVVNVERWMCTMGPGRMG